MIVFSKRNIVIPGPDGQKFLLKKDGILPFLRRAGNVP